ncbi:MAG: hypothetical protein HQL07_00655 [Nitrospirae bacterium]|nr:hypothetical protein [Magnetococcales bacterium]
MRPEIFPARMAAVETVWNHVLQNLEAGMGYIEKHMDNIHGEMKEIRSDVRDNARTEFRDVRDNTRTDFRILLFSLIFGFVCVFGAMVKGFGWLN